MTLQEQRHPSAHASKLPRLFVRSMLATESAELLVLYATGLLLFILRRRIVSSLAVSAL